MNVAAVCGTLSRPVEVKTLPSGEVLASFDVTVRAEGQAAESVPVVWFGAPDRVGRWPEGTEVVAMGRIRRRFFRAGGVTQSRTELVAAEVLRRSQRARVRQAVRRLEVALGTLEPDT